MKRTEELDRGDQKIHELIRVLDSKKQEDIERTFKAVSRNFREIFHELTGGSGNLVMQKREEVEKDDSDEANADQEAQGDGDGRLYIRRSFSHWLFNKLLCYFTCSSVALDGSIDLLALVYFALLLDCRLFIPKSLYIADLLREGKKFLKRASTAMLDSK